MESSPPIALGTHSKSISLAVILDSFSKQNEYSPTYRDQRKVPGEISDMIPMIPTILCPRETAGLRY